VTADEAPRPRRPAPVRAVLALLVCAIEAAILAWAMGGLGRLLAHSRALALVACWAMAGVVLAISAPARGRAALSQTAEGRLHLLGLGLIPMLVAPLSAFGERIQLWPLPGGEALRWSGVALAALGLGLRVLAMRTLGTRFSPTLAVQQEHRLETTGLYARVRHPGYLGTTLAALGGALTFGSALGLVPVAALLLLLGGRMRREEAMLAEQFGEGWRAYRARSGALWPRFGGPGR
jgi:protein-S-isoprenylcysteine O-methyltransferase Ste14